MLQYVCDWCKNVKQADEAWIVGLAVENLGTRAARREVSIMPGWRRDDAVNPFAVHFCCQECKVNYMDALFQEEPGEAQELVENTVQTRRGPKTTKKMVRKASARPTVGATRRPVARATMRTRRRKRA